MPELFLLADQRPARAGLERTHPLEHLDRMQVPRCRRASSPDVALELAHRPIGVRAEHAVLAAGVESERIQLALQGSDVVAPEERGVQVQGAIAEPVPGLDELTPRVGPHEAVDAQAAPSLEGAHGCVGRRSEAPLALLGSSIGRSSPHQAFLDVADLRALVAEVVDAHATSLRRAPARRQPWVRQDRGGSAYRDRAPTIAGSPSGQVRLDVAQDRVLRLRADHPRDLLRRP